MGKPGDGLLFVVWLDLLVVNAVMGGLLSVGAVSLRVAAIVLFASLALLVVLGFLTRPRARGGAR